MRPFVGVNQPPGHHIIPALAHTPLSECQSAIMKSSTSIGCWQSNKAGLGTLTWVWLTAIAWFKWQAAASALLDNYTHSRLLRVHPPEVKFLNLHLLLVHFCPFVQCGWPVATFILLTYGPWGIGLFFFAWLCKVTQACSKKASWTKLPQFCWIVIHGSNLRHNTMAHRGKLQQYRY